MVWNNLGFLAWGSLYKHKIITLVKNGTSGSILGTCMVVIECPEYVLIDLGYFFGLSVGIGIFGSLGSCAWLNKTDLKYNKLFFNRKIMYYNLKVHSPITSITCGRCLYVDCIPDFCSSLSGNPVHHIIASQL